MPFPSTDKASRLRSSLCKLRDDIDHLLDVFLSHDPLVCGSVYELRRKCGKPSCACASGKALHSCMAITWSDKGHKRLRSLSPKEEMELKTLTQNYRRFRQARAKLLALQKKLLGIIDQLDVARRREP